MQRTFRRLQPTGRPHEVWAAIYRPQTQSTEVGRYNTHRFTFTPLIALPAIQAESMDLWVDAEAKKFYLTYHGHLLRLPLPDGAK